MCSQVRIFKMYHSCMHMWRLCEHRNVHTAACIKRSEDNWRASSPLPNPRNQACMASAFRHQAILPALSFFLKKQTSKTKKQNNSCPFVEISYHISQARLDLTTWLRMTWKCLSSFLYLSSAGTADVSHHLQLFVMLEIKRKA